MALFTSLNTAVSGLNAAMAALQTTGHNIANAATPGFSRQRVELEPQRPQNMGRFSIGRGVSVNQVSRIVDLALENRLRDSAALLGSLSLQVDTLQRMEQLANALSDADLGSQLNGLFGAIQDWANDPDDMSTRAAVLESAKTVTDTMNYLSGQVQLQRQQLNEEIGVTVDEINRITDEIADLNRQVLQAENGGVDLGSANDLRDRRDFLVRQLSDLIGVQSIETSTGELNVIVGSAFIVSGQQAFDLTTIQGVVDGLLIDTPVFANGSAALDVTSGKLGGLIESRDTLLREFQQDLDVLANQLAFQFNRIQSTGQGLQRFQLLTSLDRIPDSTVPIAISGSVTSPSTLNTITDSSLIGFPDQTGRQLLITSGGNILEKRTVNGFDPLTGTLFFDGDMPVSFQLGDRFQITELEFPVENGSFDFVVTNEVTGISQNFSITVDLDKLGADTTLADIAAQINAAVPGAATILADGRLRLQSTSSDQRFSFANDSSGFVAAMGLNTFFEGSDAGNIKVNAALKANPALLSAAQSGAEGDNANALAFASLRSTGVIDGATLEDFYQGIVGSLGTRTSEASNRFENQQLILQQLENQRERVSGVNIDEEAVKMLEFQRAFQASARFIGIVDSLLDTLINGLL